MLNLAPPFEDPYHRTAADAVNTIGHPCVLVFEPVSGAPRLIVSRLDAGEAAGMLERAAAELRLAEAAGQAPEPEPPGPSIPPPGEEPFTLGDDGEPNTSG